MSNYGKHAAEKIWRITYDALKALTPFVLISPNGDETHGTKPRALSKRAFAEGADVVEHNYDLNLDPEK